MKTPGIYIGLVVLIALSITSCSPKAFSIEGNVTDIERGKDGYTAKILTGDNKTYHAVISRVNMQGKYRELQVGDKARIVGDTTHLGADVYVKVKGIE